MVPTLGKRKRVAREEIQKRSLSPSPESGAEDVQDIFRRAFEARFEPLNVEPKKSKVESMEISGNEEDEETDWSGIDSAEDDDREQVELFDYTGARQAHNDRVSKAEMHAFMSSKPPSSSLASTQTQPSTTSKSNKEPSDDPTEVTNLKNDLALQKLLRDSHLLSQASGSSSTPTTSLSATGINRHKSTDLHLQALGAKSSVFSQKNKPMAQRKHEINSARLREEQRRAEAKENGVVLERERKEVKKGKKGGIGRGSTGGGMKSRSVGGPSVGRFKGGTLTLSKKDVSSITGEGESGRGRKGKGRRKKGRR